MRTVDELPLVGGPSHPQPLASHAPTPADMNAVGEPSSAPASAPQDSQAPQGATSPRPSTSSAAHPPHNPNQPEVNGHTPSAVQVRSNGTPAGRPSLARAKSDFGPRMPEPPSDSADEASSVDGHFKIRHGWDDQLNSEEYNNLLASVGTKLGWVGTTCANFLRAGLFHVLHRQEA